MENLIETWVGVLCICVSYFKIQSCYCSRFGEQLKILICDSLLLVPSLRLSFIVNRFNRNIRLISVSYASLSRWNSSIGGGGGGGYFQYNK